jgi:hypothetical protein
VAASTVSINHRGSVADRQERTVARDVDRALRSVPTPSLEHQSALTRLVNTDCLVTRDASWLVRAILNLKISKNSIQNHGIYSKNRGVFELIHTTNTLNFSIASHSTHPPFIQVKQCWDVFIEFENWHDPRRGDRVVASNYNAADVKDGLWVFHDEKMKDATSELHCPRPCSRHDLLMQDYSNDPCCSTFVEATACGGVSTFKSWRLGEYPPYFTLRTDALNHISFCPHQKCTTAICMLAYAELLTPLISTSKWRKFPP